LDQYRDSKGRLLEIGVQHGGSSLLWHEYLPEFFLDLVDTQDIVPDKIWHNMDPKRYDFYQADAYCKSALDVFSEFEYDIIIDDGPHTLVSQQFTVQHYYPLLKSGGVMVIEDIQDVHHLDALTSCVAKTDRDGIRIFDVRETKGRYDDLIWAIIKP
jgi:cephalosporin hydroxylase